MDAAKIKALLGRLGKPLTKALEAAAGTCVQATHYEITVEHCLLKLLEQPNSDFAMIVNKVGLSPADVSDQLQRSLADLKTGNHAKPRFSEFLLTALGEAWVYADLECNEEQIRSVHLIVALCRDANWLGATGLEFLNRIQQSKLEDNVPKLTLGSEESSTTSSGLPSSGNEILDKFTVDLVAKAIEGKIDPVIGRDTEIFQVIDILSRRRKNNPILVGDPGVGKSAIVEGLSLMIAEDKAPPSMKGIQIRNLDLGQLKAGASMKGEFEERIKQVLRAVQDSPVPIILFIDEAHTLIGAGGAAGSGDAANLLKPALARGELRTIAATTWSEYKKYIEKDAALERRFQVVKVDEPSVELAASMLRGLKHKYESHHGVRVLDSAIEAACRLSDRFISGRQLPDKAIDLLDTACARVKLSQENPPYELTGLENEHTALSLEIEQKEKEATMGSDVRADIVTALRERLELNVKSKDGLHEKWQAELTLVKQLIDLDEAESEQENYHSLRQQLAEKAGENPLVHHYVSAATVANIVSQWTGVPVGKMVRDQLSDVLEIEKHLNKRVMGQDHALALIAKSIKVSKAKVGNPDTPIGVFLAVGPSGTGKTETALTLADLLFGGERFTIQINMSEYQEKHTLSRLIGSPPGYVGYGEGGILTEAVRQRPYSVVLLDEVEKGHPDVMNLFYQVFDKGHCADGEGRIIDFKNTIIILTSNLDSQTIEEMCAEEPWPEPKDLLEAIRPTLNRYFKPALLARMSVIPYYPISEKTMKKIVTHKLRKIALRLHDQHGLALNMKREVFEYISDRCRLVEAGARNIDHILNAELLPALSEKILARIMEEGDLGPQIEVSIIDDQFHVAFPEPEATEGE